MTGQTSSNTQPTLILLPKDFCEIKSALNAFPPLLRLECELDLTSLHNGWKLKKVTGDNKLNAAKGFVTLAQDACNALQLVKQVTLNH